MIGWTIEKSTKRHDAPWNQSQLQCLRETMLVPLVDVSNLPLPRHVEMGARFKCGKQGHKVKDYKESPHHPPTPP